MALRWKKMYGQHLLHDKNILKKIAAAVGPVAHETVVEIGCGSGALTEFLVESPAAVVGIEIDEQFYPVLDERFGKKPNFRLVRGDILDIDLNTVLPDSGKAAVTGNLPYNLTSQILFRLFRNSGRISRIVILVQKEVAQRIAAPAGGKDRGILSAVSGFHADTKMLFTVSRNCFFPKPKVDSAVVSLRMRQTPGDCDPRGILRAGQKLLRQAPQDAPEHARRIPRHSGGCVWRNGQSRQAAGGTRDRRMGGPNPDRSGAGDVATWRL